MVLSRDKSFPLCLFILKFCIEKVVHNLFSVLVSTITINCPLLVWDFSDKIVALFLIYI